MIFGGKSKISNKIIGPPWNPPRLFFSTSSFSLFNYSQLQIRPGGFFSPRRQTPLSSLPFVWPASNACTLRDDRELALFFDLCTPPFATLPLCPVIKFLLIVARGKNGCVLLFLRSAAPSSPLTLSFRDRTLNYTCLLNPPPCSVKDW